MKGKAVETREVESVHVLNDVMVEVYEMVKKRR